MKLDLAIEEGSEAHTKLGELALSCYDYILGIRPELHDGLGNCWIVAAGAHGAAQVLGIKARLCGGRVRDRENGEFFFGGEYHYWTALNDGMIIDSPNNATVMVHADQSRIQYVAIKGVVRPGLRDLADNARIWLETQQASEITSAVTIP